MVEEFPISFSSKSLIGVLYTNDLKPKFVREQFTKDSPVYVRINEMSRFGFDYSYIDDILVIEDNALNRINFNCILGNLDLNTSGDFIAFFHMKKIDNTIFADSLTLPDIYYLKKYLMISNLNITILNYI